MSLYASMPLHNGGHRVSSCHSSSLIATRPSCRSYRWKFIACCRRCERRRKEEGKGDDHFPKFDIRNILASNYVRERFNQHLALDESQPSRLTAPATQFVVAYAPYWPSDYLLPGLQGEVMGMVPWFASMAYGGIHLAAWHDDFPSEAETIVWRFSTIFIGSSGLCWFLLNGFAHYSTWASSWWDRFYGRKAHWTQYMLIGAGAIVCGITYILSRVFLVVDGIVSLQSAPSATYNSTDWTVFVPHL